MKKFFILACSALLVACSSSEVEEVSEDLVSTESYTRAYLKDDGSGNIVCSARGAQCEFLKTVLANYDLYAGSDEFSPEHYHCKFPGCELYYGYSLTANGHDGICAHARNVHNGGYCWFD